MRRWVLAVLVLVAGCATKQPSPEANRVPRHPIAPSGTLAIGVAGNQLVDASGAPIRLIGVNRSGTEYACAQGWGIFDGPSGPASVAAIAAWHVNVVRVPLNEACWLDLKKQMVPYNPDYAGGNYRRAIARYVRLLHEHGMYAVLELHWNGTENTYANWQHPMPDAAKSPAFWTSVATTFRNDRAVLFDLFNEPNWKGWDCWLHGCTVWKGSDGAYEAAGMQSLVDAIRATGSKQPILLEGYSYSADVSGVLDALPEDPANALVVSPHLYDFSCKTLECVRVDAGYNILIRIAKRVPVVFGELGEKDCSSRFVVPVMTWADQEGFGYMAWAWNKSSCSDFPALITSYAGTPTAYGAGVRAHFARADPMQTNP